VGIGHTVEFQHSLLREEHIRTNDRIIIAAGHPRFSSITLFFSLILLFAGLHGANAEIPGQPGTHSTAADSDPVSTETTTQLNPSSPAAQQELQTGQTPHPETETKTGDQLGPQVDPCFTVEVAGDNWMDQVHNFVQDNTCEPAVWFDTFFVKDHILLDPRPGLLIVLRNSVRSTEGQGIIFIHDYHLEWKLPQWKKLLKRWRVYFDSRSEADRYTIQPGQPIPPGVDRETGERKATIGVRTDMYTRLRALVSIDTGVKLAIHPDAHVRLRYQYTQPFGEVYTFRFSQIAMYQAIEHFTDTTQLDLERKITAFTLIRWRNDVTYTEGTAGVAWNTGVSLFTQLTPKSAISYDTNMWGVNHPDWVIQNYRVGIKYRRNFYRTWLFYELEPEITWPIDGGHRNSTYALMATLEIQFGK
jgi:hypothetical protein